MKKFFFNLLPAIIFFSCSNQKGSANDEKKAENELLNIFPELSLPFVLADTTLKKKIADSLKINHDLFYSLIPDSVIKKDFGNAAVNIYPNGKITLSGTQYLVFTVVSGVKRAAYLAVLDSGLTYRAPLTLVSSGFRNSTMAYGSINQKYLVTTYRERVQPETKSFKRNVYSWDHSNNEFVLILTEPAENEGVINPIDSFPATHQLAGDYVQDNKNFITFRDAPKKNELLFFVHFEQNKGDCLGELKGIARITSDNTAVYNEPGNSCSIEFSFMKNKVEMKEIAGCGSFRDIYCFFEGSFPLREKTKENP